MVRIISVEGAPPPRMAEAPGKEPSLKRPASLSTTCPECFRSYKTTNDNKYLGAHAEYTGCYGVRDVDGRTYRIYFCPMDHVVNGRHVGSVVFVQVVHFRRCPYKNEIIEQDTDGGYNHYVTCLEPYFECDRCRRNVPVKQWFCETLDVAPMVRFIDVYNDPWFEKMKREWIDEEILGSTEGIRKWMEEKVMQRR